MNKVTSIMAVALLMFVAFGALYAGYSFITNRSGVGLGMNTAYLGHSPFSDYFVPGIILFVVNGLFNIIAAIAVIRKIKNYACYIIIQGMLLCGWIIVQVIMVRDIALQHLLFFSIGVILTSIGIILLKKKSKRRLM